MATHLHHLREGNLWVDVFGTETQFIFIFFLEFLGSVRSAPWMPVTHGTGWVLAWKQLNPKSTPNSLKYSLPPKIQISTAYIQLASWYQVKDKALTLSSLSSTQSVALPCCDGPQVYYRPLCFSFSRHPQLCNIQLACDVSAVWLAGGERWEWLSPRPFPCALLSLRSAAVRYGRCHNCSIHPGRLRRVKPPKSTQHSAHFVWLMIYDDVTEALRSDFKSVRIRY